ncbi:MAG: acyl-ACP--UDP-N-acetylglucosamine O-acyltransferase [Xanthobacteraceae bacterium]
MIDATACVAEGARIGEGVVIGPYCIVGPGVELGDGVRLIAHVHLSGVTRIGEGTVIYPFASLGGPPQSVHYHGGATRLIIGPHCDIREGVTVNRGTEEGNGVTRVGERCFLMVGCHVAHDCQVGNGVTFANLASLGGHVSIGDNVVVGALAGFHQFCRVGEGVMVGGMSPVRTDIIPFAMVRGENLRGLNVVGLRRRGASRADLQRLRHVYRSLFFGKGVFAERVEEVAREFAADPAVGKIIDFIRAGGKRALMRPASKSDEEGHDSGLTNKHD